MDIIEVKLSHLKEYEKNPRRNDKAVQTFPQDYNFIKNTVENATYVCGMSVPPNMMAHIATQIWRQWLRGE